MCNLLAILGGPYDMLIILVLAMLLFGNRLPAVMRSLGQGVTEFKKGVAGLDDESEAAKKPDVKIEQPRSSEQHPA